MGTLGSPTRLTQDHSGPLGGHRIYPHEHDQIFSNPYPQDHCGPSEITMDLAPNRSQWTHSEHGAGGKAQHEPGGRLDAYPKIRTPQSPRIAMDPGGAVDMVQVHEDEDDANQPPDSSASA